MAITYEQQLANQLSQAKEEDRKRQADPTPIEPESGSNFRQMKAMAKNLSVQNLKNKAKEKVTAPIKMGTNRALQYAWGVLIPSWGLSIIYINMHVFLRFVFPDLFCKLGEEWVPKTMAGESTAKNVAGTAFGIVEIIGLLIIDVLIFFIILSVLGVIVMIVDFMRQGFWEQIKSLMHFIWTMGWTNFIKPLIDLFLNKG
jgi:hypothetical protein